MNQNLSEPPKYEPFFSVVMTGSRCNAQYLHDAVTSLACQTLWDCELVFVCDDSRTVDQVESLCDYYDIVAVLQFSQHCKTRFDRFSQAVGIARGKWILVLDSDDILHPDALWTVYRCLKRFPQMNAFCGTHTVCDIDCNPLYVNEAAPLAQTCNSLLHTFKQRHVWGFKNDSSRWPADIFIGSYPVEDYWMFVRWAMACTPILHIPHNLYAWRVHPGQWTQLHKDRCEEMIKTIQTRLRYFISKQSPMWFFGDAALAVRLTSNMVTLGQEVIIGDDSL